MAYIRPIRRQSAAWLSASLAVLAILPAAAQQAGRVPGPPTAITNDLDAFMARVLERRDETWRKLHDYVLDETEEFRILGPGGLPLHGMKREFTWYVREGFLVRSPVRFDGVALGDADRRGYEQRWLEQEKRREERAAKRAAAARGGTSQAAEAAEAPPAQAQPGDPSLQEFVDQRGEPRFISEAYFLRFKFEPGNYYFAGRDTVDGRPVVKIEYYPTRLFSDDHRHEHQQAPAGQAPPAGEPQRRQDRRSEAQRRADRATEEEYQRKFNKVALVTLWVDPAEHQIVRYTFDNMDFGFLPGRWLVRVDEARASMTMARVLDGVWLPASIDMRAALSLANGAYAFNYDRRFSSYRKAETGARIRNFSPGDR
jgi:hypothetical protein